MSFLRRTSRSPHGLIPCLAQALRRHWLPQLLPALLACILAAPASGQQAGLNDTGSVFYANASSNALSAEPADYPGQDARYGRDAAAKAGQLTKIGAGTKAFDFTKIANNGTALPASAVLGTGSADWGCTRDNVTGLMWQANPSASSMTWDQASAYPGQANAPQLCGYYDWRLPTVTELTSIVDFGQLAPPAVSAAYFAFPNTATLVFWSAVPYPDQTGYAWSVDFSHGTDNVYGNSTLLAARLVRGGSAYTTAAQTTPTADFVDNGNGTVTHQKTGLTWMRCALGQTWSSGSCTGNAASYTWQQALSAQFTFTASGYYAGQNGWRLPNVKELQSLYEFARSSPTVVPAINTTMFPNMPAYVQGSSASHFWSASANINAADSAWTVGFDNGDIQTAAKTATAAVRLVNGGYPYDAAATGTSSTTTASTTTTSSTTSTTLAQGKIFGDNFDTLNSTNWWLVRGSNNDLFGENKAYDASGVTFANGVASMNADITDQVGVMYSRPLPINKGDIVTITRRAFIHAANRYFAGAFNVYEVASPVLNASKTNTFAPLFGLMYYNFTYNTDLNLFSLIAQGRLPHGPGDFSGGTAPQIPPLWDQWFDEEIVYNSGTGETVYKIGGVEQMRTQASALTQPYIKIMMHTYGWYTGHYTQVDSLSVSIAPAAYASTAGNMATARYMHTATLLPGNKVLIAGGWFQIKGAELYDPVSGTFSSAGNLNPTLGRGDHTATLLPNGKVLLAGGSDPITHQYLASAELYDPASGTFTPTGNMSMARTSHTATLLPSGKVLIAGGSYADSSPTNTSELYDPATGTFSASGTMSTNRTTHVAVLLKNNKVLIAGGSYYYGYSNTAELYDPATGTFTATAGSMSAGRAFGVGATLLNDGRVLITGGGNSAYLSSAEIFDPATNTFSATGSMFDVRRVHTSTLLPDGKALIAGGQNTDNTRISGVEIFDPATGAFTKAANMTSERSGHTATLLPNGQVLIAGGANNTILLNTAELLGAAPSTSTSTSTTTTTSTGASTTTTSSTTTTTLAGGTTAGVVPGWNLLGNGLANAISVSSTFGDPNLVTTVWKWLAAKAAWAFYTPTINDGGAAYAASKGYDFLTTIDAGDGFWVNAKGQFALQLSGSTVSSSRFADAPTGNALPSGWSLIAIGDNRTPAGFAASITTTPPMTGQVATSVTTLWAWDAPLTNWYFFAPALVNAGTQASYISSKGYLDFGTNTLTPTTGFWVNHP